MARISTDQQTVLQAVVDRLITQVSGFSAATCVISDDTEPMIPYQSNLICFISPMGGQFAEDWLDGGGSLQCHEQTGVVVSVWTQMALDQKQRISQILLNTDRGLLKYKKAILKAFTGHDLVDGSGNTLLTSLMKPINSQHRRRSGDGKSVGFSLSFSADFLWDLT